MKWEKKGLVYCPDGQYSWAKHSALTPTPILLDETTIRVYAGFRDQNGLSRIGFVDVSAQNPSEVKQVSKEPLLNLGKPGTFDDNGMILGDVIRIEKEIRMYYVGFQLVDKIKFQAFSGVAMSTDNGDTFKKLSEVPILDRSDEGLYIRAIHSVLFEDGVYKIWYATGNGWEQFNKSTYPQYDISYTESLDGLNIQRKGRKCIKIDKKNMEYRIGRPRVYKIDDLYIMNFTYGTLDGRYFLGQAESSNGVNWRRNDDKIGIDLSQNGWDSRHLCYPALLQFKEETYMFYNGNNMGKDGFGYAVLRK